MIHLPTHTPGSIILFPSRRSLRRCGQVMSTAMTSTMWCDSSASLDRSQSTSTTSATAADTLPAPRGVPLPAAGWPGLVSLRPEVREVMEAAARDWGYLHTAVGWAS